MLLGRCLNVLLGVSGCISIYMEKESDFCRAVMKTPSMFLWSGEGHRGENLLVDDEGRWMHPYDAKITTFIVA